MLQVLFRRGGIREPRFRIQSKHFLLFPTAFHTEEHLLKPEAAARYAEVSHAGLVTWALIIWALIEPPPHEIQVPLEAL